MYQKTFLQRASGLYLFYLLLMILLNAACAGKITHALPEITVDHDEVDSAYLVELERIAELERSGVFFPGLAFYESSLREAAGDFAGAAVAAYKELSWAYAHSAISREQVEEGLITALGLFGELSSIIDPARAKGTVALRGCLAFARENWKEAEDLLTGILTGDEESDSFLSWMLMVTEMEQETFGGKWSGRSAYSTVRARYTLFPEYWYRGARAFSGPGDEYFSAVYAEHCIEINPQGPFADDARLILASIFPGAGYED